MSSSENTPDAGGPAPGEPVHEPSVHTGMEDSKGRTINPWAWIPTTYLAQGLQYAVVIQLFAIVFFTMGVPAGQTLLWVGLLSLPWTLKPLWGPLVDRYWKKRSWTFWMQILVGLGFAGTAFALQTPFFFTLSILFLLFMAFAAATHDIALDGYYMLGLREKQQAFFVGVRSTCFRLGMIAVNGVLVWVAGLIVTATSLEPVQFTATSAIVEENGNQVAAPDPQAMEEMQQRLIEQADGQAIIITPLDLTVEPGGTAEFHVRLAEDPGPDETVTVIVERTEGDASLFVPRPSQRFEFDTLTWEIGFTGVIEADDRLTDVVSTTFEATAGNIPLGWAIAIAIVALYFLFAGIYHRIILPYPKQDAPDTVDRPPFYVPLFALGTTVGVPAVLAWGLFIGLGKFTHDFFMEETIGVPFSQVVGEQLAAEDYAEYALGVRVDEVMDLADRVRAEELTVEEALEELDTPREVLLLAERSDDRQRVEGLLRELGYPDEAVDARISELQEIGERALEPDADIEAIAEEEGLSVADVQFYAERAEKDPRDIEVQGFEFFFAIGRLLLIGLIATVIMTAGTLRKPVSNAFHYMSDVSRIGFADVFVSFFTKGNMAIVVAFLLTFRLGEAQLAQVSRIFLVDTRDNMGMSMTLQQVSFTLGIVYLVMLTIGGLLGGFIIARYGLRNVIWYMVAAMHLPNLFYIWLAVAQPDAGDTIGLFWINAVVGFESFGYGLGFTAYLMIMILAAQGPYKTSHYALCTGFMALGFMLPGMWSGYLSELTGYLWFFILVMIFTLPGVILIPFLKIDPNFGMRGR